MQELKDLSGIPRGAFSHVRDQKGLVALTKLPGAGWALRQLIKYSYEKTARVKLLANAVKVGPEAYPELGSHLNRVCTAFAIAVPELFIMPGTDFRAYTTGADNPTIVITSGLLEALNEEEAVCLLAHQVSHLHCSHMPYLMLCEFLRSFSELLGIASAPLLGLRLAVEEWRRSAELSCDRGAALVAGKADTMLGMISKLAGVTPAFGGVTPAALAEQKSEFAALTEGLSVNRFYRMMMYLEPGHEFAAIRFSELREWSESEQFTDILAGKVPDAGLDENEAPHLWGEFVHADVCPSCGRADFEDEGRIEGLVAGLKTAASGAVNVATHGVGALNKAFEIFSKVVQPEGKVHSSDGTAIKIPVREAD